ncbi:MAG: hypothetical protein RLZ04_2524, partial [Actinomycetota bacterium]
PPISGVFVPESGTNTPQIARGLGLSEISVRIVPESGTICAQIADTPPICGVYLTDFDTHPPQVAWRHWGGLRSRYG